MVEQLSEVSKLFCRYKDGTTISFIENVFELTEEQRNALTDHVSKISKEEHRKNPHKMNVNDIQKKEILAFKEDLIDALKDAFSAISDEELAEKLYEEELIVFSPHALERLTERFTGQTDSPFGDLFKLLGMSPQSKGDLAREGTEIFVKADTIGDKVEWSASEYCRINYSLKGDKTHLCVETQYLLDDEEFNEYFLVITVIKKEH